MKRLAQIKAAKLSPAFAETVLRLGAALLFGFAVLLMAETHAHADELRTIVVSGEGEASGTPDQAMLTGGVVTQSETAAAALSANTAAMNKVFATLKSAGIAERDIQTSNFSVNPQYAPYRQDNPDQQQKIVGYQVSNQVNVRVRDLSKLGATLDALVRSGANSIGGVSFDISKPAPLAEQARKEAVADAMAKAKTLAEAAGVRLGPIQSISESGGVRPLPMVRAMAFESAKADVPVAAGEQTVSVNVSITYLIQ